METSEAITENNQQLMEQVIDIVSSLSNSTDAIKPDTRIIDEGFIDSLSVFNIIVNLEKTFNVSINAMDATIDDFQSPNSIAQLIIKIKQR